MRHRGRVGAVIARDHRHVEALSPKFDLLDGRCAKCIASGQYHGMLLVLQEVREFSARSRFSSPVYADEGDYRGTLRRLEKAWVCSREAFGHLLLRNFEDGHAGTALRLEFFPDRLDDLAGHSSS